MSKTKDIEIVTISVLYCGDAVEALSNVRRDWLQKGRVEMTSMGLCEEGSDKGKMQWHIRLTKPT